MDRDIQLTMRNVLNMKTNLRSTYFEGIKNYIKAHGQPYGEHNDLFIDVEQDLNGGLIDILDSEEPKYIQYVNLKRGGKITLTDTKGYEYEPSLSNEDIYILGTIFSRMC